MPVLVLGEPIQGVVGVSGTLSDGNEVGSLCGILRLDEGFLVQSALVSFEAWTVFDDSGNVNLCTKEVLLWGCQLTFSEHGSDPLSANSP